MLGRGAEVRGSERSDQSLNTDLVKALGSLVTPPEHPRFSMHCSARKQRNPFFSIQWQTISHAVYPGNKLYKNATLHSYTKVIYPPFRIRGKII